MNTTVTAELLKLNSSDRSFSATAARRRSWFSSANTSGSPWLAGASLKASSELNTSPTNSATAAPASRERVRNRMIRVWARWMDRDTSTTGVTTMAVATQSMPAMMAMAPTAKTITPGPSTHSSRPMQPSSTSSRTRLTISLDDLGVATAAGSPAINRMKFRRTWPVMKCHSPPQSHSAPKVVAARVKPIPVNNARARPGESVAGASDANPS